jgi:hypothetical protein
MAKTYFNNEEKKMKYDSVAETMQTFTKVELMR